MIALFLALIGFFYIEEDVAGKLAWIQFRHAEEAKGEKFDWSAFVPPTVPDEQNLALTPLLKSAFDYTHATNGQAVWRDSNAWQHAMSINLGSSDAKGRAPELKDFDKNVKIELGAAAEFYRGNTNYPQSAMPQDASAVVLAALNKFTPDLDELRKAVATRPFSRFPIEYDYQPAAGILLPHLACIKGIVTVCAMRAAAELAIQRGPDAFADVQLEFRLSDSIRDEPFLIDHLVRISCLTIAIQDIRDGIILHTWTEPQLLEFETHLGKLDLLHDYQQVMRGERAFNLRSVDYLRNHGTRDSVDDSGSAEQSFSRTFNLAPNGWYYRNMRLMGETYRDFLLPMVDETNRAVSPGLRSQMEKDLNDRRFGPYNFIAKLLLPSLSGAAMRTSRAQTWVDEARVACALERYRLEHRNLPDRLSELKPQFIPRIPVDLFDGRPLRYQAEADGSYILYSIGWNEVDDGGVSASATGRTPGTDPTQGDWVWKCPAK